MNLATVRSLVVHSFWRAKLLIGKASPHIFVGLGIAGGVASTVMACKATKDGFEEINEDYKYHIQQLRGQTVFGPYSEKEFKRDKAKVQAKYAIRYAKLYAPSATLGVVSIVAIVGGHLILTKRNIALMGAYKLLDEGFKEYRRRVVEDLGADKDDQFRYGKPATEEMIVKKAGSGAQQLDSETPPCEQIYGESIYARFFDESNPQWRKDHLLNSYFLRSQEKYANQTLHARGHLFLNEVYDALAIPRTSEGALVGWVDGHGDSFVDFGLMKPGNSHPGVSNGVWLLDFNVDGVIYDLI